LSSIFIGVMGAPFVDELTTTLLRIVAAALEQEHETVVWTCGGATTLTNALLGRVRPRNLLALGTARAAHEHLTTAGLIEDLLAKPGGRLTWLVCRHCMEERGVSHHVAGVKVVSPFKFLTHLEQAGVSMIMGQK
jgi:sulfur relay (sulfurtransferase) complex TusBCD TusD component (DsrE family)